MAYFSSPTNISFSPMDCQQFYNYQFLNYYQIFKLVFMYMVEHDRKVTHFEQEKYKKTIYYVLPKVCRLWKYICKEELYGYRLIVDNNKYFQMDIFENFTSFKDLYFNNISLDNLKLKIILQKNPHLKLLSLNNLSITTRSINYINKYSINLKTLYIKNCKKFRFVKTNYFKDLFNRLNFLFIKNTQINYSSFDNMDKIKVKNIILINNNARITRKFLQKINPTRLTIGNIESINDTPLNYSHLKELFIYNSDIDDTNLISLLNKSPNVRRLLLKNCWRITPLSIEYIFTIYPDLEQLYIIGVSNYYSNKLLIHVFNSKLKKVVIKNVEFINNLDINVHTNNTITFFVLSDFCNEGLRFILSNIKNLKKYYVCIKCIQ